MTIQLIKNSLCMLFVPLLLLSACSSVPKNEWDISQQEDAVRQTKAQASGEGVIVTKSAQPARLVRSSKSAPWLADTIVANYRELDAKTATLCSQQEKNKAMNRYCLKHDSLITSAKTSVESKRLK